MIAPEEILEALDLTRAEPGIGLLEALHLRFVARVPFESATKILRNAAVAEISAKPRRPDTFWRDHLEAGAGGTCFARVAAFGALLEELGFSTRRVLGRVGVDFDHAALLVARDGREWICDVGYPLPSVLPAAPGEHPTPRGSIRVAASSRGLTLELFDEIPEGPRRIEIFSAPVAEEEFERRWQDTFRPAAHFLKSVGLLVERDGRKISFAGGSVRVDDLHSRLTVPLAAPRPRRLAEIFGIDESLLADAFAVAGDPEPASAEASLSAYLETAATPDEAFAVIATPRGYGLLLEGVAAVLSEEPAPHGFRLRLAAPGAGPEEASLWEDVEIDREARRLTVRRSSTTAVTTSRFCAETREGRTYLIRDALLAGPREDLLRNDSLRGRLAGSLAVDLLAWARRLTVGGA